MPDEQAAPILHARARQTTPLRQAHSRPQRLNPSPEPDDAGLRRFLAHSAVSLPPESIKPAPGNPTDLGRTQRELNARRSRPPMQRLRAPQFSIRFRAEHRGGR